MIQTTSTLYTLHSKKAPQTKTNKRTLDKQTIATMLPAQLDLILCNFSSYLLVNYITSNMTQIVFLAALVYVTVFRRQISCNSDYAQSESNDFWNDANAAKGSLGSNGDHDDGARAGDSDDYRSTIIESPSDDGKSVVEISSSSTPPFKSEATSTDGTCMKYDNRQEQQSSSSSSPSSISSLRFLELSQDLQIQCLTYLHPRDVVSFGCCNRLSRFLIDNYKYAPITSTHGYRKTERFEPVLTSTLSRVDTEGESEVFEFVEGEQQEEIRSFSDTLWLHLWNRDYAWILHSWNVGKGATKRSIERCLNVKSSEHDLDSNISWNAFQKNILPRALLPLLPDSVFPETVTKEQVLYAINRNSSSSSSNNDAANMKRSTMKEFYFTFSQTWLNYTIAGHSTFDSCLTGIHGHVFNITHFLDDHPGSPESILIQGGGRDSTSFFEGVGHSISARKVAVRKLVEVVNLGCCSGEGDVGLRDFQLEGRMRRRSISLDGVGSNSNGNGNGSPPSSHWPLVGLKSTAPLHVSLLPKNRSRPTRTVGTLSKIRHSLKMGEKAAKADAIRMGRQLKGRIIGKVNIYYDPLDGRWHGWYLNSNFDPTFVSNLNVHV